MECLGHGESAEFTQSSSDYYNQSGASSGAIAADAVNAQRQRHDTGLLDQPVGYFMNSVDSSFRQLNLAGHPREQPGERFDFK